MIRRERAGRERRTTSRVVAFAAALIGAITGASTGLFGPAPAEAATLEARRACQAAIEAEGHVFVDALLGAVARCADVPATTIGDCLATGRREKQLRRAAQAWRRRVEGPCAGVTPAELGHHAECAEAESACGFASASLAAPGDRNDLIDCLACRATASVSRAAAALLPPATAPDACRDALGKTGVAILGERLDEIAACLLAPRSISIAACLSEPARSALLAERAAGWRAQAQAACSGRRPVDDLGYPLLCAGNPPTAPPLCSPTSVSPCGFRATRALSLPGADDDLVDCLDCQVGEAVLDVARDLHGAEVCCTASGCGTIRTRAACLAAAGSFVHYRIDWLDVGGVDASHGVAVAPDGAIVFSTFGFEVKALWPDGSRTSHEIPPAVFSPATVGIALDPFGSVFGAVRNENRIFALAPSGAVHFPIGTGVAGHGGDGGPASAATIAGPDGVAVDPRGTIYLTESGVVASRFQPGVTPSGEHLRAVDAAGTIRTVAGAGPVGTAGAGGLAEEAQISLPYAVAVASTGRVLVGEAGGQRLLDVDPGGRLFVRAGRPQSLLAAYSGDGGPALDARFSGIEGIAEDGEGKIAVSDFRNMRIRLVDRLGSVITIAGTGRSALDVFGLRLPGAATRRATSCAASLAAGPDGRLYFPDSVADAMATLTPVPY